MVFSVAAYAAGPSISAIDPNPIDAGGPYFPMTITGSGFVNGSVARWGTNVLSTVYLDSGHLQAQVTPDLRLLSGGYPITVTNPNLAVSNQYTMGVLPVLASVTPGAVQAGSPGLTVRVRGIGLTQRLILRLSSGNKPVEIVPAFGDSTTVTAVIPASAIANARTATVQLYDPVYNLASGTVYFEIRAIPAIKSLAPNPVDAGGGYFLLDVIGTGFAPGDVVNWPDGSALGTVWLSDTHMQAAITPELRALAGNFNITVTDPSTTTTSNAVPFTVAPVLFGISPSTVGAGGTSITVTATGAGFTPRCVIRSGNAALSTTYTGAAQLTAVIPAELLQRKGTLNLQVADGGGSGMSLPQTLTISQAVAALSSIAPSSVTAASPAFTLSVRGDRFVSGAAVRWNGNALPTTFVGATQLTALVAASLVQSTGTAIVTVANPGGDPSGALTFTIQPPAPTLSAITPSVATAGSASLTLTATGANCAAGCAVQWNGSPLSTTVVSATQVTAVVPAAYLASAGSIAVRLVNANGATSNAATFVINPAAAVVSSLSPAPAVAGSAFTLTVSGSGFAAGATVQWNGVALATTFVSPSQLAAYVPASVFDGSVSATITVVNPGGAVSKALTMAIASPQPVVDSISPAWAEAGSAGLTLSLAGSGFVASSKVAWNGAALATRYGSGTQLVADVPADLLASAGTAAVTVSTAGAAASNAVVFTIGAPVPRTSGAGIVNAASGLPGAAPGSLISIFGTNLAPAEAAAAGAPLPVSLNGTSVSINGVALPLVFVSSGQINAQVPFEIAPGSATLVVQSGGVKSAGTSFEVKAVSPGVVPVVLNAADGSVNSAAAPARAGQYLTLWVTGQGAVTPAIATGDAGPGEPFAVPVAPVQVEIGGGGAEVAFAGLAPGLAGLMQVNVAVPELAAGWQEVVVTVGGVKSNGVMVFLSGAGL